MMRRIYTYLLTIILLLSACSIYAQSVIKEQTKIILPDEKDTYWWSGVINHAHRMPIQNGYSIDLYGNNYGNQIQPLVLSSDGRIIWSEHPFRLSYHQDSLTVTAREGKIKYSKSGNTLQSAFSYASSRYFPPNGKTPHIALFEAPQYNTWIELMYDQNQKDVLEYATNIIKNGFPPGVIMIDDNWQKDYGVWEFKPDKFPSPKKLVDSLHNMGFQVMLWVCPFVSPDSRVYRKLRDEGLLLKNKNNRVAIKRWWNGASAVLDFTNPLAKDWYHEQLEELMKKYNIDGYKFDGGDTQYYTDVMTHEQVTPNQHTQLFGEIGLQYPLNEFRAMWKMGGKHLVQRLRDKEHNWKDLQKLIPGIIIEGLMGYPFTCPDMIGGGGFKSFMNADILDQELIVRSTQCHALMPMMQFSAAPWRVLDEKHLEACKEAVKIRQEHKNLIISLAKKAAETGEPIVRSMAYVFPDKGYDTIQDQFMLGDDLMVAPIVENNKRSRKVQVPEGMWKSSAGETFKGPKTISMQVALDELPYFKKLK